MAVSVWKFTAEKLLKSPLADFFLQSSLDVCFVCLFVCAPLTPPNAVVSPPRLDAAHDN